MKKVFLFIACIVLILRLTDMYCFDIKKPDYLPYTDVLTPGVTRNMVFSNKLS